ncbi:MAG: hypothetical protein JNM60_08575 [Candidatus Competibacteraceae bacterium]|nr:hypothetical protein [Candidatus Competibacteraceae bacterium]
MPKFGRRLALARAPKRQLGRAPVWLLVGLGLLGGVGLYWYTTPQAVPAWARKWLPLPGLPEYTGPLYRWRDDRGREQITDKPPKNRPYETQLYRANTNVVPPRQ